MKIVHMEMNNRHIKPKVGGYFSQNAVNSTQSPVGKAIYMKFDSSDSPTSRISPAAELVSERVWNPPMIKGFVVDCALLLDNIVCEMARNPNAPLFIYTV